jgi:enamine deaminase RidA (YjgF/YER057c/UK114 family)
MSQVVVHGNTVYLAGQVGEGGGSAGEQTKEVLATIDALLKEVGSDKSKILQAIIWLADIKDFAAMNAVWEKWLGGKNAPARATGEAKLVAPQYKVEIIVTAAVFVGYQHRIADTFDGIFQQRLFRSDLRCHLGERRGKNTDLPAAV